MKLYSKKQLVTYSISTGILAAVAVSVVFTFFKNDSPQKSGKEISAVEKNQSELKEEIPQTFEAFPVVAENGSYTQDESQNISVYEKCNEAVVNITTKVMGYNWFYDPIVTESGSGSGSIIDKRGYVVTNVHVIEKASVINISLAD